MEIKLGGSFAGYFAVLALLFINHDVWNPPPPPPAPPQAFVWHLSGQITDQAGVPVEGLKQGDFEFSPLTFQQMSGGHFTLTIPTEPQEGGGTRFPTLVVNHHNQLYQEDFDALEIPVDPSRLDQNLMATFGISIDASHHLLKMQHIQLKRQPRYDPNHPTTQAKAGSLSPGENR
jgi:hypothetical protein